MPSEKVSQLQLTQQNLQSVVAQKQQLHSQLSELDSALENIPVAKKTFKIIGKIMVLASPEALKVELLEKKNLLQIRLKNFIRQEENLNQVIESLQNELLKETKTK